MNVENLATVMGINLLKPQIEDPIAVMKGEEQTCGHLYNPEIHLNVLHPHFFIFYSDSSDPEADDSHNKPPRDPVSSFQRRAPHFPLEQGGQPEEHSTKLRWLGVCRGTRSWMPRQSPPVQKMSG